MKKHDSFRSLARKKQVLGKGGLRDPESLWHIEAIKGAKRDANRVFRNSPVQAKAVAIDQARNLALFPDKQPVVSGSLLDLDYETVEGELYYRLRIDDGLFGNRSLRVFFWPQKDVTPGGIPGLAGTIWILGLAWRPHAYKDHMKERIRKRLKRLV